MIIRPAPRLARVRPSGTVALADRARTLAAAGRPIVDLTSGAPDIAPAAELREAVARALDSGWRMSGYVDSRGLPELREELARATSRECGRQISPDEIVVTAGAKGAIFAWCQAFLSRGDEVLVPIPAWMTYDAAIAMSEATPVPVPMRRHGRGFVLDVDRLAAAVTDRTRAIILNLPHNPTGAIADEETLAAIIALAERRGLLLLADESLLRLVYDGAAQTSLAALSPFATVVRSFSKTYSVPGWRVGYAVARGELIAPLLTAHQHMMTCVPGLLQAGVLAAMRLPERARSALVDLLSQRRRTLAAGLDRIDGISCDLPPAGLFCFADISGTGLDDRQFAERAIERAGVAMVPGSVFGPGGECHVRVAFGRQAASDIERALVGLEAMCAEGRA
jgi:aspartate/methionine/tyrosine aminotransferase